MKNKRLRTLAEMPGRLRRQRPLLALLLLTFAVTDVTAESQPAPKIEAMPLADMRPGCGCSFYLPPDEHPGQSRIDARGPVLRWSLDERGWGRAKLDGEVRRLKLLQEKHLPEPHEPPRYGDRLVLIFQEDWYHVEVLASVIGACRPKATRCTATRYRAELRFRHRDDAPRVFEGIGECGC